MITKREMKQIVAALEAMEKVISGGTVFVKRSAVIDVLKTHQEEEPTRGKLAEVFEGTDFMESLKNIDNDPEKLGFSRKSKVKRYTGGEPEEDKKVF